jgi:hypothetical protein
MQIKASGRQPPSNTALQPTAPGGAIKIGRFLKSDFPAYECSPRRGSG